VHARAAAAELPHHLLQRRQSPQVVVLDDEQDLHGADVARLLQDLEQLLETRPVVDRDAEVVDDEQRPARRRRRHRVLVDPVAIHDAAGDPARLQKRHHAGAYQRALADPRFAEQERRGARAREHVGQLANLAFAAKEEGAVGLGEGHERFEWPEVTRDWDRQAG
jgi:hypothetical protein